ncbi:two-component system, OmpR family, sensor histidine kinase TctE [Octadecabacter temperatus]|uniref:histidine kinase n=1 Tax=Octadecabacter temperatus TaxID=1458307 RepID=A0A0K0Y9E5_9RHOB|nr:sensor histidine kinase [Octadecabacter temperatus]AKS47492.1 Sensor protein QseC [Octadecabacter temperatus]SIO42098.1 two-component system, OmpR family, sensor histidine kinase TctE [Octadecabacter temperatus]
MTDDVNVSGSLRNRLALILTGGAAVLAAILFVVVRALATQVAQQGQDNILNASMSSILDTAIIRDGRVTLDFPYSSLSMLGTSADDRVFYAIYENDSLLSGYGDLRTPDTTSHDHNQFTNSTYNGDPIRIATGARILIGSDGPRTVSVSIAQTQDALSDTLNIISRNVALIGLGFFVLSSALALWAASATSGQLHRLTRSVTRRGPQDLSPVTKEVPSEMGPLVGSLNTFMSRLNHTLTQSEDFIAEAAHRIRTPLATVRSHAEATLQRVEHSENRAALQSMVRAIDESSRAAGQLLDHAMVTFRAENLETEDVDLVELLRELVQRMTPVADMKDITITLNADGPVVLSGDAILLQNALRNLIDNALKYAPAETAVVINVSATPEISVSVMDGGSGFATDEITTLSGRFVRGKDTGNKVGSGLGLTIAKEVTTAHGGTMSLQNRSEGGACVTLHF